ncbi:hypothetical protein BOX15_Mlig006612g1 [Macrostomum lignano]|uniref:Uncharacterized protein n=2 Tax=Macrostomum lignano TaxID=282301 RepID=A0A267GTL0_9PLAT|nr:hypothetical protein BOX15_Mlig006612g1 [Macrostomum lignano]
MADLEEAERIALKNRERFKNDLIKPKLNPDQVMRYYDDWSSTYDDTMYTGELGYSNFTGLCEVLTELLPKDADRSKLRALDLGCGTGIIGKQLRELLGFRLVDGVDGSPGMIAQAEKLGIICRGYVEIVENRSLTQVPHGVYDVVVSKGAYVPNHVKPNSLPFVGELLKPGGLLCTEIRRSVIEETDIGEIEPEAKKMEASGGWKILKWRHESVYNLNVPGFIYVLQKL